MVEAFVGKIFVVRPPTTKTTNILPHENYPLYGIYAVELVSFNQLKVSIFHVHVEVPGILVHHIKHK